MWTPNSQTSAHRPQEMQEASRSILYFPIEFRYRSGAGQDFPFDDFLRPAAVARLRLDLFLNLDIGNSCGHAFTCAKKCRACVRRLSICRAGLMPLQGSGVAARIVAIAGSRPAIFPPLFQEEQSRKRRRIASSRRSTRSC